jgi:hypothetical protein
MVTLSGKIKGEYGLVIQLFNTIRENQSRLD